MACRRAAATDAPGARIRAQQSFNPGGTTMKNPLDSLWGTVIAGLVLTVILYYLARAMMGG
jgi:hypothetical protein